MSGGFASEGRRARLLYGSLSPSRVALPKAPGAPALHWHGSHSRGGERSPKGRKFSRLPTPEGSSHQGAYRAPLSASRASSSMPSPRATSAHVPLTRERVLLPPRSWRLLHRILPGETEPPHSPHSPAARLHGPRPQRTDSASRPGDSRNCLKPKSLRNPERRRMAG